jgi:hypothetical protein
VRDRVAPRLRLPGEAGPRVPRAVADTAATGAER